MKHTINKSACILFLSGSFLLACATGYAQSKHHEVKSPDGLITLIVSAGKDLAWQVDHEQTKVITPSAISLTLSTGEIAGKNVRVLKTSARQVNESFHTPFYKKSDVMNQYNQLLLACAGNYSVEFRVYNDGVAYRFLTNRKGDIKIQSEEVTFNFAGDYKAFIPYINNTHLGSRYSFSFESFYDEQTLSQMFTDSLSIVPLLVELEDGKKAAVMEADVEDYPGLLLLGNPENSHSLKGAFAPCPLEGEMDGIVFTPTKFAGYIASVKGTRSYPWRAVVISREDKELADNDMIRKLASPSRIKDPSWIKPGKAAWDWWNSSSVTGVDFKTGMNTRTFKYFIDFAAANRLEYVVVDAGWSGSSLMDVRPEMNIKELVDYGKQKDVGIILWAGWNQTSQEKETVFPFYAGMGVKGFKVDFFDNDNQLMIRSMFEIAEEAAKNKLLLDLHGIKPTGVQQTYPNVLNIEGVKGLENFKWAPFDEKGRIKDDAPRYDVTAPYIRMLAGPMDYTPGAMKNATRETYRSIYRRPMSQGTRVRQMAMYTVFEAPLQMLADSPTDYMREQECTDFIAKVPTVFDQTVALDGKVGEFIILARRKEHVWYAGALTNWTAREVDVDFSFLDDGGLYEAEIFMDGINSDTEGVDYRKEVVRITSKDKKSIQMYPGGGWTARIYPVN
ncbi:MAG: glycoside hydrolase family 97 protein [Tannerellaceae bacterium]|jgi:alpha-glucosidase|nr:glycoside hydrolase family 97 protein [Tannerellaceae bacterium]